MLIYTLRRLIGAVPTLLILVTLTFFLLRLAPGGPFDTDRVWPAAVQENIARKYGLDLPLYEQYFGWLWDLMRGDLRESFQHIGQPVTEIIGASLPVSALLGACALGLAVIIGIPLGCLAAWKRNTFWDFTAMFVAVSGVSLPSYLVASALILVFALGLGWFPPALWESPISLVLPVITLALRPMAIIARLTRTTMIETLHSDYIRTAYAKGLPEKWVIIKHALRNSLIPVVTILGPLTANVVTGSFVVEVVFQLPGMGRYFVSAVLNRDYPLVMGVTLTYGLILILCNLAVDLAYGWVDPRIRVESA